MDFTPNFAGIVDAISGIITVKSQIHTNTPLLASEIFVSNAFVSSPLIKGWVYTDVSGSAEIEQSFDSVSWRQGISFNCATGYNDFIFQPLAQFFRIRYTNGLAAQGFLQIITSGFVN